MLPIQATNGLRVQVANGDKMCCLGKCMEVRLELPGYSSISEFFVLQLEEFEVVLGIQWLKTLGIIMWNFESSHKMRKRLSCMSR